MPKRVPTFRRPSVPNLQRPRVGDDAAWQKFMSGVAWQKLRGIKKGRDPHCEIHLAEHDQLVDAHLVHHQFGRDMSHALDLDSLWSVCRHCHAVVTAHEARCGVGSYPYPSRPTQPGSGMSDTGGYA